MTSTQRVLVADLRAVAPRWAFPDWAEHRLHEEAPPGWRARVVSTTTVSDGDGGSAPSAELLDVIGSAEVYAGFGISRQLFKRASALRWVHSATAGVASALFPEMRASSVVLTNSAGVHAIPIAEHVVGGVLHFLRSFDIALSQQRSANWDRAAFVGERSTVRELSDCRALVVGAGGLGSQIARRLSFLGCACVGVRRRPELGVPDGFERVVGPDEWRDLLPGSDVLILAAPGTPETRHLVTRNELQRLPVGAILVNVARGTLLDEEALLDALQGGSLRGAVLDVFEEEPLNSRSRLWQFRNVLLTPHVSGVTGVAFWRREIDLLMENWRRWAAGQPLRNVVDKDAGY